MVNLPHEKNIIQDGVKQNIMQLIKIEILCVFLQIRKLKKRVFKT